MSLGLLQLLCVHLYVEKRQSGDKLELLLDGESLLDAAHLVMKSMIMIMRSEEEDEQHCEEYFDGDYDDKDEH